MWISRAEYNRLKAFEEKRNDSHIDYLLWELNMHKKEKIKYREQCEEYKRKYADEVNKRLELIKFYEEKNT